MKLNFDVPVLDFTSKPISDPDGKIYTFKDAVLILANFEDTDHRLTAEKKSMAFEVGVKVALGGEIELTIEQIAFIKERAAICLSALVYGRLCELVG